MNTPVLQYFTAYPKGGEKEWGRSSRNAFCSICFANRSENDLFWIWMFQGKGLDEILNSKTPSVQLMIRDVDSASWAIFEKTLDSYQYCYPVFLWSYKPFGKICKVLSPIFISLSVKSFQIHFVASFVHCYTRLLLFLTLNVELNFCIDNSFCHLPARNFFCGQIKPGKQK